MTTPDATLVQSWLDESPFSRELALAPRALDDTTAHLFLENAEPLAGFGALHGGAAAAVTALAPQALVRAAGDWPSTVSHHVVYARAARGTGFDVRSRLARGARELRFFATELTDDQGREVVHATTVLSVEGDDRPQGAPTLAPPGGEAPELDAAVAAIPFLADRGLHVTGTAPGEVELTLAPVARNLDRGGAVHEGAVLTLIDAAGASCPWTSLAPGDDIHGATVSLQVHMIGSPPTGAVVARAQTQAHGARLWWSRIEVVDAEGRLCATATATYRVS